MKFIDDRYSSGLNTSVTFYEIYWLVNRSRDKLVRCQSAYCFESGKMPFVYVERSNDSISVFDSKCSRLYRRDTVFSFVNFLSFFFFLSLSLFEILFRSVLPRLISVSSPLSLFDLVNYTSINGKRN